MKKISLMKIKKHVTYVKESFVRIKMIKIIKTEKRVKDHSQYTGKFRGAARRIFNLRYKVPDKIPTIIHNAS